MKKEFENSALEIIGQSSILEQSDFDVIAELKAELKENFLTEQIFRTRTEMEVSVLNDVKFPTPDSKYWQAVREQGVMFHELVMLSYEYRKNLVEIKKLERSVIKEKDELEKELFQIELEKKNYIARKQERVAKDRIREIKNWHEIKEKLIPQIKYGKGEVNNHQLISYTQRFIKQAMTLSDGASFDERKNILSLLATSVKKCRELGIWEQVLAPFNRDYRREIESKLELLNG